MTTYDLSVRRGRLNRPRYTPHCADLRREADEMVARGEMPSREDFLRAVAEVRREYQAKLRFERLKSNKVLQ